MPSRPSVLDIRPGHGGSSWPTDVGRGRVRAPVPSGWNPVKTGDEAGSRAVATRRRGRVKPGCGPRPARCRSRRSCVRALGSSRTFSRDGSTWGVGARVFVCVRWPTVIQVFGRVPSSVISHAGEEREHGEHEDCAGARGARGAWQIVEAKRAVDHCLPRRAGEHGKCGRDSGRVDEAAEHGPRGREPDQPQRARSSVRAAPRA